MESPSICPSATGSFLYLVQASQVLCHRHLSFPLGSSLNIFKKLKKKKKRNESCKVNGMQASDLINSHPHNKCLCSFVSTRNWAGWDMSEAPSSKGQTMWGQGLTQAGPPSGGIIVYSTGTWHVSHHNPHFTGEETDTWRTEACE